MGTSFCTTSVTWTAGGGGAGACVLWQAALRAADGRTINARALITTALLDTSLPWSQLLRWRSRYHETCHPSLLSSQATKCRKAGHERRISAAVVRRTDHWSRPLRGSQVSSRALTPSSRPYRSPPSHSRAPLAHAP